MSLLKSFTVSEKSTEYIINRLKQLSINENSIDDFNDQDLIDIIESLNSNWSGSFLSNSWDSLLKKEKKWFELFYKLFHLNFS